ncbi:MAG: hypothetical protein JRN68_11045, partial [Nitrososphaerota archaeon]|nr:hypothetical protein [Nitrososphaerota archaeon]
NFLADRGYVSGKPEGGQLYMGKDPDTGEPMWKEPETEAEKMQARQVFYSIVDDRILAAYDLVDRVVSERRREEAKILTIKARSS